MATLKQKIAAEQTTRELLRRNRLPTPDWVEYGFTCIRLFWEEEKVVMIVDIDELDGSEDGLPSSDELPLDDG